MAIDFKVGIHRSCTLHTRQEYRGNALSDEARNGRKRHRINSPGPYEPPSSAAR
ncbi:hypothetical protein QF001_006521 [Paraburkholderia youngii]|uniref:hypothetical protein n=1 Tax=Paraburkholderia youngii TaxID=2782701 RepID=UPI003D233A6F